MGLEEGTGDRPGPTEASAPEPGAEVLYQQVRSELLARGTPLSTYRLQLHREFTLTQAEAVLPYLAKLGISHLYRSPALAAMPGSRHGYDVIDHTRLNPELGTPEEHRNFGLAVRRYGMRQLLDTVPNHMGIEQGNRLWDDVLENGPASRFAPFFDIDWDPVKLELRDKVLLPVLGDQYGVVLERGELKLGHRSGAFFLQYYERTFPLGVRAYAEILGLGLPELERRLGPAHPALIELESIRTAVEHLPRRHETERAKVLERAREKEVIKRRLARLLDRSSEIAAHVERAVQELNGVVGEPRSFDRLDQLLQRYCPFRLAHWRVAGEEINYRRFFDINGLAAIRVEAPEVFQEAHQLIFDWLAQGLIDGLRIDHPDGLFDPTAYFLDVQERFFLEVARRRFLSQGGTPEGWVGVGPWVRARWRAEAEGSPGSGLRKALYVVVEKIQGGRERIPEAWAVHGTTGYRFANNLSGIFVDRGSEARMTEIYARFIGHRPDYAALLNASKRLIMSVSMASEINALARELNRISEMDRRSRDFTLNSLRHALVEFIAHFPVYRTYIDGREALDERDVVYLRRAIARAKASDPTTNASVFDFLESILLRRYPDHVNEAQRAVMLRFAMRVQQVTGPVMAKGLEDTVFYRYNRLTSLNEVGGEPDHYGSEVSTFHLRNQERVESWPAALLASSTHDSKRSEDVRARINVLSELPEAWREHLRRFSRLNRRHRQRVGGHEAPAPNDEYLFYQTLLGAWPMGASAGQAVFAEFAGRLSEYMLKAVREAKELTSWINPDPAYEEAVRSFVAKSLDRAQSSAFLALAESFQRRLELPGQLNGLGQVLCKMLSPGVPDLYQGCELWDLSLVDPDNRRPVDFDLRSRLLDELDAQAAEDPAGLCRRLSGHLGNGRAKLYLTACALRLRQRRPELFRRGAYHPLDVEGERSSNAVALGRSHGQDWVVGMAPRLLARLLPAQPLPQIFSDSWLMLPQALAGRQLRDVLSGRPWTPTPRPGGVGLPLGPLLADFPVVLLESSPLPR